MIKLVTNNPDFFFFLSSQVWMTNAAAVLVHTDTSGWALITLFR